MPGVTRALELSQVWSLLARHAHRLRHLASDRFSGCSRSTGLCQVLCDVCHATAGSTAASFWIAPHECQVWLLLASWAHHLRHLLGMVPIEGYPRGAFAMRNVIKVLQRYRNLTGPTADPIYSGAWRCGRRAGCIDEVLLVVQYHAVPHLSAEVSSSGLGKGAWTNQPATCPINLRPRSRAEGGVGEQGDAGRDAERGGGVRGRHRYLRQLLGAGLHVHRAVAVHQHLAEQNVLLVCIDGRRQLVTA